MKVHCNMHCIIERIVRNTKIEEFCMFSLFDHIGCFLKLQLFMVFSKYKFKFKIMGKSLHVINKLTASVLAVLLVLNLFGIRLVWQI